MTNEGQQIVWSRTAEPFGQTVSIKGPDLLNLRFPGQYHDAESGLDQNGWRSYASYLGRYTQADPIGLNGGNNRFAYVGGNPINRIDPTGRAFDPSSFSWSPTSSTSSPTQSSSTTGSFSWSIPTNTQSSSTNGGSCSVNNNGNGGEPTQVAANGGIYKNIGPGFLPIQPPGYYTEVYIPTDSGAAGTERLIYGQGGDVWYSPDHYYTFVRIK